MTQEPTSNGSRAAAESDTPDGRAARVRTLREALLQGPGETPAALRAAIAARAASLGGRAANVAEANDVAAASPALAAYVDKVALHAYRVVDRDVAALREAGHGEEAIFEITLSAALGAGLGRLERGLAALRGQAAADL